MFHHNKRPTTNRAPTDRLSERAVEHLEFPSALYFGRVREIKVADQIAKSIIVISRMQKRVKVKVFERTSVVAKVESEINTVGLCVSLAKKHPFTRCGPVTYVTVNVAKWGTTVVHGLIGRRLRLHGLLGPAVLSLVEGLLVYGRDGGDRSR